MRFIEVTPVYYDSRIGGAGEKYVDGKRTLVNISHIISVYDQSKCQINIYPGGPEGVILVRQSYDQIIDRITDSSRESKKEE